MILQPITTTEIHEEKIEKLNNYSYKNGEQNETENNESKSYQLKIVLKANAKRWTCDEWMFIVPARKPTLDSDNLNPAKGERTEFGQLIRKS